MPAKKSSKKKRKRPGRKQAKKEVRKPSTDRLLRSMQKRLDTVAALTNGYKRKLRDIEYELNSDMEKIRGELEGSVKESRKDFDDKIGMSQHELNKTIMLVQREIQEKIIDSEQKLLNKVHDFDLRLDGLGTRFDRGLASLERLHESSPELPGRIVKIETELEVTQEMMAKVTKLLSTLKVDKRAAELQQRVAELEKRFQSLDFSGFESLARKIDILKSDLAKLIPDIEIKKPKITVKTRLKKR